ncbi:hypothetical protein [Polaromonas sp. AET17H-212]|uniref:hypothetical protein n=1 Tax=Polaromonas sp. AET17H-212 TaxID=1977061 RepID=UPI001596E08E|nr:hypothetical protein [Polaromonas sp. AET17H-212]
MRVKIRSRIRENSSTGAMVGGSAPTPPEGRLRTTGRGNPFRDDHAVHPRVILV